jgi:hypothetical protein
MKERLRLSAPQNDLTTATATPRTAVHTVRRHEKTNARNANVRSDPLTGSSARVAAV